MSFVERIKSRISGAARSLRSIGAVAAANWRALGAIGPFSVGFAAGLGTTLVL
jgi:hypothetical protein